MKGGRVRNAALLGIMIIVLAAAATWFLVLSPRLSQASDINTNAETVAAANLQLQNRYNQTIKQADTATQAAKDAQALFSTMPEKADLPTVLTQIADAATRAGIKPGNISVISTTVPRSVDDLAGHKKTTKASEGAVKVNLAQMDVSLTVSGARKQLLEFLDNLQGLDRAILIKSSDLTTSIVLDPENKNVTTEELKVTGSMFVLQSKLPDLVANVQRLLEEAKAGDGSSI